MAIPHKKRAARIFMAGSIAGGACVAMVLPALVGMAGGPPVLTPFAHAVISGAFELVLGPETRQLADLTADTFAGGAGWIFGAWIVSFASRVTADIVEIRGGALTETASRKQM